MLILGPKLNAPGRIGSSDIAIKLLCATSISEATNLCDEIEELNIKRKEIENIARDEALDPVREAREALQGASCEGLEP